MLNYGLFDFNAPGFVYRFVKGETDYFVGLADFNSFVQSYAAQGRRVVEQQLDLTGEEKSNIIDLAQKALLPENRVYRYNYVKDNCSTRCLQLIEAAVGDTLTFKRGDGMPENTTFRREMKRFPRIVSMVSIRDRYGIGERYRLSVGVTRTCFRSRYVAISDGLCQSCRSVMECLAI